MAPRVGSRTYPGPRDREGAAVENRLVEASGDGWYPNATQEGSVAKRREGRGWPPADANLGLGS